MRTVVFFGSLVLWFCSCGSNDHGAGQGPGTDTTVNQTTSTPNNPAGNAATDMGGDTGTVKGTGANGSTTAVRSGATMGSGSTGSGGSTGGNNMNSSGTTSTNRSDSASNRTGSNKSGGNSGSGSSGTQHH